MRWKLTALVSAGALVLAVEGASAAPPQAQQVTPYLKRAAPAIRSAEARITTLEDRIGALVAADQGWLPLTRRALVSCRKVSAFRADDRLLRMLVPNVLRGRHVQLARAYGVARDGCADLDSIVQNAVVSMSQAIASGDVDRILEATDDLQFAIGELQVQARQLRAWSRSVTAWRFGVLQRAAAERVTVPAWVRAL